MPQPHQSSFPSGAENPSAAEVYHEFYERFAKPDAEHALFIGSRVLHFNAPSTLGRRIHVIGHERLGHSPVSQARPEGRGGKVYDTFGYDPAGFSIFTTDGTAIQVWRTQRASADFYGLLNGIDRPFMKDGVPIYERNVEMNLELLEDQTNRRAWLHTMRLSGEGTFRLQGGAVGWILHELESRYERNLVLPADEGMQADAAIADIATMVG